MHSLWIGASGLRSASLWMETLADNVANVNTHGFRRRAVDLATAGADAAGPALPGAEAGVRVAATRLDPRPGMLEPTGDPLHLAIEGEGFFRVRRADGAVLLTRDGSFRLDGDGRVVTAAGALLLDSAGRPVVIPDWAEEVAVGPDGTVRARGNGREEAVAALGLAVVPNPTGLLSAGDNLYAESEASGAARVVAPGTEGTGTIRSGVVERANADLAGEMVELILAQRLFQLSARVIQGGDEMLALANRLRG